MQYNLMDKMIKTLGFDDSYYGILVYKFGMIQQVVEKIREESENK